MRSVLVSLCLVSALFSACSSTDGVEPTNGGAGGMSGGAGKASGGAGANDAAGASGASGAGDEAGAAGSAGSAGSDGPSVCLDAGLGEIELVVTGLPVTVAARVRISGPEESLESESTTLSSVSGGQYVVSAQRVYDANPLVRTAYDAQVDRPSFCLEDDGTQTVNVNYAKVTPSNRLWALVRTHGPTTLLGFAANQLAASGSPDGASASLPVERSMAFDHDGNLWAASTGDAQPSVVRYSAAWLAGVGVPRTDFAFSVPANCAPAIQAVALDASGNVWLSSCSKQVLRLDPMGSPGASEEPEDLAASVTLSGLNQPSEDLAFDSAGNLWLAAGGRVLRFDRARLGSDDSGAPDLALDVTSDEATPQALVANFLAFDTSGNLWAIDSAGHALFEVAKSDLDQEGTHTVAAKVKIALALPSVDPYAMMSRPAFDDEGSLWLPLVTGEFGKLTAEQLAVSSSAATPTVPAVVISHGASSEAFAFFPAAGGLPLPSAQP